MRDRPDGPLVCVVDDDVSARESVVSLIRTEGYDVEAFDSAQAFLGRQRGQAPACLVLDLNLPGMTGADLQQELARTGVDVPIIFLTGHGDIPTSVRAIKAGALEFFTKPFEADDLVAAVRMAATRRADRGEGGMVGASPALRKVLQQVDLVAETDATVLITGESGTGKELVARAIHERSRRRGGALVKVNCGAIPDTLFESEFFGHVKGSFTGALGDRPGRFELAHGGTLVLDEIGEVPLAMQPRLLRALQEKEVERIGDVRSRKVDVRIVAATNRDLAAEVEAGRFRADLFYRLSVFPIRVPSLRERREDIPLLAQHFVRAAARRIGRDAPRLSEAVLAQMSSRDWPGNIRELENAIERAVILAQGGELRLEASGPEPAVTATPQGAPSPVPLLTRSAIEQHQRDSITAALAQTGGKVAGPDGAAALLGLKPTTLYSRIIALGLRRTSA
jgi:DNA-binding NtrC family response regulator